MKKDWVLPPTENLPNKLIYLHGFNSASVDDNGDLLQGKTKLQLLSQLCAERNFIFVAPNLDYREPLRVVKQLADLAEELDVHASYCDLSFIGTSLGGFMAEVMARETATNAIMINPAIKPSESLVRSIGPLENYATGEKYTWIQENCDAFKALEMDGPGGCIAGISRTVIVDLGDEILDARQTIKKYEGKVALHVYEGGSHRFDHMEEALPKILDSMTTLTGW
jgi:predicted esterase YcpF (UPF0227 family)